MLINKQNEKIMYATGHHLASPSPPRLVLSLYILQPLQPLSPPLLRFITP